MRMYLAQRALEFDLGESKRQGAQHALRELVDVSLIGEDGPQLGLRHDAGDTTPAVTG